LPKPERLEILKVKGEARVLARTSNDNPSAIISKTQETISEEALVSTSTRDAYRQFINKTRKKFFKVKGLRAKCIEDIVVPEELQKTIRGDDFYFGNLNNFFLNALIVFF
jgi:hypothetical protein